MNSIFIVGPDRLSIKRFIQFTMKYLEGYEIGTIHNLMTEESINLYVTDFFDKYPKRLMSYYMKGMGNKKPLDIIDKEILNTADLIIWFDLYSLKPEVVKYKEDPHILKGALMDWKKYVDGLNI